MMTQLIWASHNKQQKIKWSFFIHRWIRLVRFSFAFHWHSFDPFDRRLGQVFIDWPVNYLRKHPTNWSLDSPSIWACEHQIMDDSLCLWSSLALKWKSIGILSRIKANWHSDSNWDSNSDSNWNSNQNDHNSKCTQLVESDRIDLNGSNWKKQNKRCHRLFIIVIVIVRNGKVATLAPNWPIKSAMSIH